MDNSASRDVIQVYRALYDYLVNKSELTPEQSLVKSRLEKDQGIICDSSLDSKVLAIQASVANASTEEEKAGYLDALVSIL